jgi:hypothetical protein
MIGGMKLQSQMLLLSAIILASAAPGLAQVEKVAMRTTGISCGVCAGLSEMSFRRIPGVDDVKISLSNEAIMLTYKPGTAFDPDGIRKILQQLQVGVNQFQVVVRGQLQEQGGKRWFIGGKDKFVVAETAPTAPKLIPNTPVLIEAILNDKANPMEVKVLNVRPASPSAASH